MAPLPPERWAPETVLAPEMTDMTVDDEMTVDLEHDLNCSVQRLPEGAALVDTGAGQDSFGRDAEATRGAEEQSQLHWCCYRCSLVEFVVLRNSGRARRGARFIETSSNTAVSGSMLSSADRYMSVTGSVDISNLRVPSDVYVACSSPHSKHDAQTSHKQTFFGPFFPRRRMFIVSSLAKAWAFLRNALYASTSWDQQIFDTPRSRRFET